MEKLRIVLGNSSLAVYPEGGGIWSIFLQYLLGLDALGHDVFWLELMPSSGDEARDRRRVATFLARMAAHGFDRRCAIVQHAGSPDHLALDQADVHGRTHAEIRAVARDADLVWNFCAALRAPMLSLFRHRVFVDLDPGHLQISALSWDMGLDAHDCFLTVGPRVHRPDCEVPTLGRQWHGFMPFVHLPMWREAPDPGRHAPFTSVTQWAWEELWWEGRVLSVSKRDAYLRYLALPARAGRPFELAANIHPDDRTGDRERLIEHGWRLVHPHDVASTPGAYQDYIRSSRAEISCPKPVFRELRTGWVSDRSVCYLAMGRPVLAEDTGFSDLLPTGTGLVAFRNLEEAVAGVAAIDGDYARHRRAARDLAEAYFDSRRCLEAMLAACGG